AIPITNFSLLLDDGNFKQFLMSVQLNSTQQQKLLYDVDVCQKEIHIEKHINYRFSSFFVLNFNLQQLAYVKINTRQHSIDVWKLIFDVASLASFWWSYTIVKMVMRLQACLLRL